MVSSNSAKQLTFHTIGGRSISSTSATRSSTELGMVRQQYWIPQDRILVKKLIRRCVTCVRDMRAATPQQLMGDLPQERVTSARSFLHTSIDYARPVQLRTSKGRGHRAFKAFIAAFMCLSIRAVHLEVVSDYIRPMLFWWL